ncbi:MAG TPA: AAA family ATPase [Abditibacterium sp.]|jgi:MoxR-like ATPase
MNPELLSNVLALRGAIQSASNGLVERGALVETIALAAVAGEHILVIGPPGTAKSEAARRIAGALGGTYFEYLLGRFTEPGEIFGPVDLVKLREGTVETRVEGMLPEADFAFLDEIFLGSTAILNTLLGVLNERTFRRGHTVLKCPLRCAIGAANAIPTEPSLEAFADRFLLRVYLESVPDTRLEDLLEGGWQAQSSHSPTASLSDVDALARAARDCDLSAVRPHLAGAIRQLRGAGIALSDRRAVRIQKLVAAAAALDGRTIATQADLWPLVLAVPGAEDQARAREILRDTLEHSRNAALLLAAEDASSGPAARAARLVASARELLASPQNDASWRLKIEGVAREIDAAFAPDNRVGDVEAVRSQIGEVLAGEIHHSSETSKIS